MADNPAGSMKGPKDPETRTRGRDFIRTLIDAHQAEGRYAQVATRFPPEPNGYLHIGHAKSICLNFGLAAEYGGSCNLRFDDTNPLTEDEEYTRAIQEDVRWLGFEWSKLRHASDYFERMYVVAVGLIEKGLAYVDSASDEEIREKRGTVTEPGTPTTDRDRPVAESLDLFRRMRAGEFEDGSMVLRARINLSAHNMIMRDPVLYRIRHAHHYRTGNDWCIYPLYDYAHCLEDVFEGISHSLCTLEFDNNREIYDWVLDNAGFEEPRTHQYEFARLILDYTILSKRKLIRLVKEGYVSGWDDPRMPTIAGFRRRGVPAAALRSFCEMIGVAKVNSRVDDGKLEFSIRDEMNRTAPRAMAVLRPLVVELTNWDEGRVDMLDAPRFPDGAGSAELAEAEGSAVSGPARELPFGRRVLIDREDFAVEPPSGWKRLAPGGEVRLRNAYVIRCDEVVSGPDGEPELLRCSVDHDTLGRHPEGRKVQGTIHWVSEAHSLPLEVRLYDRLFTVADPEDVPEDGDFVDYLNPDSLVTLTEARGEPSLKSASAGEAYQFERVGYFVVDADSTDGSLVMNRTVTLRDNWTRKSGADGNDGAAGGQKGAGKGAEGAGAAGKVPQESPGPKTPRGPVAADDRVSPERRAAREANPVLAARFDRYQKEFGLTLDEADILSGSAANGDFFEAALSAHDDPAAVASWMVNDLAGDMGDRSFADLPFGGPAFGTLIARVAEGAVARRAACEILTEMVEKGTDPDEVIRRDGLAKVSDEGAIGAMIDEVLGEWAGKVAEYRAGSRNLFGLFMGQVMKKSGGNADPGLLRRLLTEKLEG